MYNISFYDLNSVKILHMFCLLAAPINITSKKPLLLLKPVQSLAKLASALAQPTALLQSAAKVFAAKATIYTVRSAKLSGMKLDHLNHLACSVNLSLLSHATLVTFFVLYCTLR
jgi:hypothetical protein